MRTVKSKPGLSHQEALLTLQRVARANSEEIVSFLRRGDRWHAELQKLAEFPPPGEDEEKSPPKDEAPPKGPEGPDDDGDDEAGPPPVPGSENQGPQGEKGEEKGELHSLLSLVHRIADKLGIVPGGHEDKLGDEGPVPPGPPGPPLPPPGADEAPAPSHLPTKMKPGEVLPHQTPVGSPAFAASRQANPIVAPGTPAAPMGGGNPAPIISPPCSKCGGPTVGGVCPACTSAAGASPAMHGASVTDPSGILGKKRTIMAKVDQPLSEVDAWKQATAAFQPHGYSVKQLVPQADRTWLAVLEG